MTAATTADLDARVDGLVEMSWEDFRQTVYDYVKDRERTVDDEDVFRSPEVVERTYAALDELLRSVIASRDQETGDRHRYLEAISHRIATERRMTRPLAGEARERAAQATRGGGPRARAKDRLAQENPVRFLELVREEQAREALTAK